MSKWQRDQKIRYLVQSRYGDISRLKEAIEVELARRRNVASVAGDLSDSAHTLPEHAGSIAEPNVPLSAETAEASSADTRANFGATSGRESARR